MPVKRPLHWLSFGGLIAAIIYLCLPQSEGLYLSDPVSILVSVAISAAITAGQVGLEYLIAKKQKVPNVDRGKQDDIRISTSGYGEFIPKGWGQFRVAPIWVDGTPIVHTVVTTPGQSGGKSPKPPTAGTEDHVYTKTVVGVFHDGLVYKGVTRIWFDTDLVYNNSQALLSTLFYDAEYGTLAGGASVATQAECSNGRKVTGLGSGGTCTLAVTSPTTGSYELAVHYTSTSELTFKISVNGAATVDLVCPSSGAATIVAIQTLTVSLTSGANTIAFSNAGAACPDLDMISLAPALTSTTALADTRSFTGITNVDQIAPTDGLVPWPMYSERPILTNSAGDSGGVTNTGYQSATLSKYGNPSIRIYPGSRNQPVDSAVTTLRGADAPAYQGYGVIVIEGLQLQNGRLPNVTMEVNQGIREVATIVQEIYDLCPPTPTLDVTALNGLVLGDNTGYSAGTYGAITWANLVNATQTAGGAITKTAGGDGWVARADNGASIASGDASIRFTVSAGVFMVGFSTTATPGSTLPNPYDQVIFGVVFNVNSAPDQEAKNAIQMSLGGSNNTYDVGVWSAGSVGQVELRDGRFRAYVNGVELVNFIPSVPSYPLYPVWMGYRPSGGSDGGGVSAASYATGANIGSEPSVPNGGGLLLTSRRSAAELLNDLQTRFQFDMIEVDGVVKAVLRNGSSDITIDHTELRAHEGDDTPISDAVITDIDPYLLPGRVDVNYLDPSMDYHNNTQTDMWLHGNRSDNQSVSLSIIDSAANMKGLATTLLNKADREGRAFTFSTGYKYMRVHPGSVVTLTLPNATHVVRVTQAKYGLPAGLCEFQGVRQVASIYSLNTNASTSIGFETPIAGIPGNTKGIIIDGPLLRAEDAGDGTQPVVYIAMCGIGGGSWPGAFFYEEYPINSGNYVNASSSNGVSSSNIPSGIGVTSTTLATVSDPSVWDRTNSLTFSLYYDPGLSSATEADLLVNPSLNLLAVINPSTDYVEYIQFKTATADTPAAPYVAKYTVSTFLRGRVGTDANVGIHTSADDVVVVNSSLKARRVNVSDLNR